MRRLLAFRACSSYLASMSMFPKAALAVCAALAIAGCQKTPDPAFGEKVRAYLLEHPEVLVEVQQKLIQKQSAEAAKAASAAIDQHRERLERDPEDFVANPAGKVTVVEFFDYRCSYCKLTAPEITKMIQDNPDIRFVFKELPIFGDVSDEAARLALTPAVKPKGLEFYQALMAEKALDQAGLDRHLRALGVDPAVAREQAKDPAIERQLLETRQLAQALNIEGTPAFVVGDNLIPGADMAALKAAITVAQGAGAKPVAS